MKIAISTSGTDLTANLDRRFGRCPKFLLIDTDTGIFSIKDNQQNLNAAQGAGIQAAQNVATAGAEAVITGHCGPKAFNVLKQAGIAIYNCDAETIQEALDQFNAGSLKAANEADVEGHWV